MIELISAFFMGLVVMVHPCAVAPNVAAMTYIDDRSKQGLLSLAMYIAGHTLLYLFLGCIVVLIAQQTDLISMMSERSVRAHHILAGLFLVVGLWLFVTSFRHHEHQPHHRNVFTTPLGAFFSGVGIACLFCPEAALVFFGTLIEMALASKYSTLTIVSFSLGSCLPLLLFAWILKTGKQHMLTRFNFSRTLLNRVLGAIFIIAAVVMMVL